MIVHIIRSVQSPISRGKPCAPDYGNTRQEWKPYVSRLSSNWMNRKGCRPFPPLSDLKQDHALLCVTPEESQPWLLQKPLCMLSWRGSPYPFLIDTHADPRLSPPPSGPAILSVWRNCCESYCRRFGIHMHVNTHRCMQTCKVLRTIVMRGGSCG